VRRPDDVGDLVERVEWEDHEWYMHRVWKPGDHCSIFAPTDAGKTHLIRWGLLEPHWKRYPVLYLDLKPKARTAAGLGRPVRQFPSWDQRARYRLRRDDSEKWDEDPQWFRLKPPEYRWSEDSRREDAQWRKARRVVGEAIDRCYREGRWVLVVDDAQTVTDPRAPSLDLHAPMVNAWRNGREQPLTVIAATQQPAGAPSQMYDQPTHLYLGPSGDVRRHYRLGEIGGDTEVIEAVLPQLGEHEFLYCRKGGHDMMVVQAPPARRRRPAA
jgi:hypothetical protein